MRTEIARLVGEGKSREQVYDYFITKYGSQEPLAAPIDKGFNRLAWLFPYLLGGLGAVVIGLTAVRWSRSSPPADQAAQARTGPDDDRLQSELDDELRQLD
jgi:cytochrome c-type biogenesis protein CcmH